jgi:hypothetical protein
MDFADDIIRELEMDNFYNVIFSNKACTMSPGMCKDNSRLLRNWEYPHFFKNNVISQS